MGERALPIVRLCQQGAQTGEGGPVIPTDPCATHAGIDFEVEGFRAPGHPRVESRDVANGWAEVQLEVFVDPSRHERRDHEDWSRDTGPAQGLAFGRGGNPKTPRV